MNEELKPCPFCGGENIRIGYYEPYEHTVRLFYYCNLCGARGGDQNSDERLAIAAWNTRVQPPATTTAKTKADMIRAMSDEELADFIHEMQEIATDDRYAVDSPSRLRWLRGEAENAPESPTAGDKAGEGTNTSETVNEPPESATGSERAWLRQLPTVKNAIAALNAIPEPCTNVSEHTVKEWFAKIDEELNEFKLAVADIGYEVDGDIKDMWQTCGGDVAAIADEGADTITAITSMLEAMGITLAERQEAQRRVNAKNRERGRL